MIKQKLKASFNGVPQNRYVVNELIPDRQDGVK
jgi:hypothetical protein